MEIPETTTGFAGNAPDIGTYEHSGMFWQARSNLQGDAIAEFSQNRYSSTFKQIASSLK